jgi:hypothetical protein
MNHDDFTDDGGPVVTAPASGGISQSQYIMLGVLGVLGIVAGVLYVAARKAGKLDTDTPWLAADSDEPWAQSLRHFAAASDFRFRGLEERMDNLIVQMGGTLPPPPAPVDTRFPPKVPKAPESVSMSNVQVGAEEPPPPGPAATSQP